eukprot:TRINITY_DN3846_c0_g1_i1.p2 TRINITY_DN3846_c0_g1~~TRINITY_DN3846_c0_g1_i1.p2  ORF type:complete len:335 (+),score=98.99 TRINITY_DN3846_c0_g1_i1:115-1005(+)
MYQEHLSKAKEREEARKRIIDTTIYPSLAKIVVAYASGLDCTFLKDLDGLLKQNQKSTASEAFIDILLNVGKALQSLPEEMRISLSFKVLCPEMVQSLATAFSEINVALQISPPDDHDALISELALPLIHSVLLLCCSSTEVEYLTNNMDVLDNAKKGVCVLFSRCVVLLSCALSCPPCLDVSSVSYDSLSSVLSLIPVLVQHWPSLAIALCSCDSSSSKGGVGLEIKENCSFDLWSKELEGKVVVNQKVLSSSLRGEAKWITTMCSKMSKSVRTQSVVPLLENILVSLAKLSKSC